MPFPEQSRSLDIHGIAVLIPCWQPNDRLTTLLESLLPFGFASIVLVNDGSGPESEPIFLHAKTRGIHILHHATNLGKGRALKTGLNFIATELDDVHGVVTADADGQHLPEDILRLAKTLAGSEGRAVLGVREFGKSVPLRSRFGNTLTRYVFWFLARHEVRDTQSGLRGIPVQVIPQLLMLKGERYEYEMNMLAHLCNREQALVQIPIETVYIDQNRSSHFNPIRDSMRIYFVLIRFYASGVIAAAIDFLGFSITFAVTHNILNSFLVGRLSSIANYLLNRRFVFHSRTSFGGSLWRYYLLMMVLAAASFEIIRGAYAYLGWNVLIVKIIAETALSLASFAIQKTFVFPLPDEGLADLKSTATDNQNGYDTLQKGK